MKVLITGGSGYLGGRLCEFLDSQGCYQLLSGSRRVAETAGSESGRSCQAVLTDFSDAQQLQQLCQNLDAIVHLAGMNAGDCSRADEAMLAQDVKATQTLLDAAIQQGVRRFIYLSSAHVYGNMSGLINEDTPTLNTHPYALNHLSKENLVREATQKGVIEGVVVRLSNAFGPPQNVHANCWMLLVNDLCRQGVVNRRLVLKSSGEQKRDFVSITQVCSILEYLLTLPKASLNSDLFNVGGQNAMTVFDMASLISHRFTEAAGFQPTIERPQPEKHELSQTLDFSIHRLLGNGYTTPPENGVNHELDALIQFCLREFKLNATVN